MPTHTNVSKKGFTIIELLIVISLLGILAAIVMMIINPVRYMAIARDSRRIQDIKMLGGALTFAISGGNISLQDTTGGCTTCTSITGTKAVDGVNGWIKFSVTGSGGLSDFVTLLPEDPINDSSYYFEFASDGNKFELSAILEDPVHNTKIINEGGTNLTKYEVGTNLSLIP